MTDDNDDLRWLVDHRQDLQDLLEEKKRWAWLAATMKTTAIWLAALAAGWLAVKGFFSDLGGRQ